MQEFPKQRLDKGRCPRNPSQMISNLFLQKHAAVVRMMIHHERKVWSLVHTYTVAFTESYLTSNLLNRTAPPRTLHQTRDPLINPVLAVDTLAIKRSARVIQRDVQDVYLSWWICVSLRHMARSQAPNEMYLYKIVMIVKKNPNNSRSHSHRSFSAVFPFQVGPLPAILQTLRFGHATAWAPARRGRDKLQNTILPATTTCSPFNVLNLALVDACCTKICGCQYDNVQYKGTSLADVLCSTAAAAARFRACWPRATLWIFVALKRKRSHHNGNLPGDSWWFSMEASLLPGSDSPWQLECLQETAASSSVGTGGKWPIDASARYESLLDWNALSPVDSFSWSCQNYLHSWQQQWTRLRTL